MSNVVFITGASEGIGRATALQYAARGWTVLAAARSLSRLEALCEEIQALGSGSCQPFKLDVSDPLECFHRVHAIAEEHRPAVAVVNAGVGQYGPFASTPWSDIDPLLRTNLHGALATVRAILPGMITQQSGSIVLVSSTIGKRALPYNATYCASKAALLGFADALRLEVRPFDVHIGVVSPARTDTRFFDRMTFSTPQDKKRNVPTSSPDLVAAAILRCTAKRRREIIVSASGKLFAFVGCHFPRISDFLLYHSVPKPTAL